MHAVVFIKQVPQQNSVKITAGKQIDASGIEPIISLFDEYALEEALLQVERSGGSVTAVTIGREDSLDALRKALAMGADDAVLIDDAAFGEIDALGAARVAAAAVRKLGDVDVIFCGKQSTDDETAVFGPALARYLDVPVLSYVFKVHELDAGARRVVADRALEFDPGNGGGNPSSRAYNGQRYQPAALSVAAQDQEGTAGRSTALERRRPRRRHRRAGPENHAGRPRAASATSDRHRDRRGVGERKGTAPG